MSSTFDLGPCSLVCALDFIVDGAPNLDAAVKEADATGRDLWIPKTPGGYRVKSAITIKKPMIIVSNGATIIPDVAPKADTNIFNIESSNVTIDGLQFDGSTLATSPVEANRRMIYAGLPKGGGRYNNIHVRRCEFKNLSQSGYTAKPGTGFVVSGSAVAYAGLDLSRAAATDFVVHGVYLDGIDDASIEDIFVDTISGSAVFCRNTQRARVLRGTIKDTGWYSVHFEGNNTGFEVCGLSIIGDAPNIRYWGASIDVMGDFDVGSDTHGRIHDVYVSGRHSYLGEGAVRISSAAHVELYDFVFDRVNANTVITVLMRQAVDKVYQAPPREISIHDGCIVAGRKGQSAIIAQNGRWIIENGKGGKGTIGKAFGLDIRNIVAESTDKDHYFQGIFVHGQDGGWDEVCIENVRLSGTPGQNPTSGLIGIAVNDKTERSSPAMTNVRIRGNRLRYFDPEGKGGSGGGSPDSGVYLVGPVDGAEIRHNQLDRCWYGIYAQAPNPSATGPTNLSGLLDNTFSHIVDSHINRGDGLVMDNLTAFEEITFTGILPSGFVTHTFASIKGARLGDHVLISPPSNWPEELFFKALVSGFDTVRLVVSNPGSVSIPPSMVTTKGVWRVQVLKA